MVTLFRDYLTAILLGRSGEHTAELHSPPHLLFPPFFFNDTATTEIYTLSLHDALPISCGSRRISRWRTEERRDRVVHQARRALQQDRSQVISRHGTGRCLVADGHRLERLPDCDPVG